MHPSASENESEPGKIFPEELPRSEITEWLKTYSGRFNIYPGTTNPVLLMNRFGIPEGHAMRWGLRRKNAPPGSPMPHNARAEEIATTPMFRDLIRSRRCLVPVSGYYEWVVENRKKVPYLISPADGSMFTFGAIYDTWIDRYGDVHESFCVIKTISAPRIARIHDRMPVIIAKEDQLRWLNHWVTDLDMILPLLKPCPDEWLRAYPVSDMVNDTRNDGPELIKPRRFTDPEIRTLTLPGFTRV